MVPSIIEGGCLLVGCIAKNFITRNQPCPPPCPPSLSVFTTICLALISLCSCQAGLALDTPDNHQQPRSTTVGPVLTSTQPPEKALLQGKGEAGSLRPRLPPPIGAAAPFMGWHRNGTRVPAPSQWCCRAAAALAAAPAAAMAAALLRLSGCPRGQSRAPRGLRGQREGCARTSCRPGGTALQGGTGGGWERGGGSGRVRGVMPSGGRVAAAAEHT